MNKKKMLGYLAICNPLSLYVLGVISGPGLLYNTYQILKNKVLTDGSKRAACLISGADPTKEPAQIAIGEKGRIAKFFTDRNVRVDYKHNARSIDLESAIRDDTYQHIVLIGHGDRGTWEATDRCVVTEDISDWVKDASQKDGYFIQLTCGKPVGKPLGFDVVVDKRNVRGYNYRVMVGCTIFDLWNARILEALSVLEYES